MAFIEHSIRENTISSEDIVVDFQDFIDYLKEWMDEYDYKINEKTYLALPGNKTQIKWECKRKPDDYHLFILNVKLDLKAKEEAKKKTKLSKGNLKITHGAKIKRDFDNKWDGSFKLLARAIYDKFFMEPKERKIQKELKNDIKSLKKAIKHYLNI
jgi:hypothetical protein